MLWQPQLASASLDPLLLCHNWLRARRVQVHVQQGSSCELCSALPQSPPYSMLQSDAVIASLRSSRQGCGGWYACRALIPNGLSVQVRGLAWMGVGHTNAMGGGNLNSFGKDFAAAGAFVDAPPHQSPYSSLGLRHGCQRAHPSDMSALQVINGRPSSVPRTQMAMVRKRAVQPGQSARRREAKQLRAFYAPISWRLHSVRP